MPPPECQTIQNKGIFHGLPTYANDDPDTKDLTAIVTGANGISGYHMVKVLTAAPASRWKKIYCLSRRPPQDYFYDELEGEDVKGRVVHASVDFLESGERVARGLGDGGVGEV